MATNTAKKAQARNESRDRRPRAVARYIRMTPSKVNLVLSLIRGKSLEEAEAILEFTPKLAAEVILKVLESAAANAEHNLDMNRDSLYVAEAHVGPGPTLKRFMPRARGSASPILKRTSHITIILDEK